MKNWKERLCAAAMLLVGLFLVACASKATNAADKIELGQKYLTELNIPLQSACWIRTTWAKRKM